MWVVWTRYSSIYYKTSDDGGDTWSEDVRLTDSGSNYFPTIAETSGGKTWVAWTSYRFGNFDIWYKASEDGGTTWSTHAPFTRFTGFDGLPSAVVLSGDRLALFWQSDRGVNYDIWSGTLGASRDLDPPPHLEQSTHRPFPNPDSEDVVTITASVSDETGIAGVELVWSVDGVSTGDRPMLDDGRHEDGLAGDRTYGVTRIHRWTGMDGVRTAEGGEGVTGAMIRARIWVDGRLAGGLQALLGAPMAAYSGCGERDGGIGHGKRRSRTGLAQVCGDVGLAGGSVADGRRQAGSGMARSRARARLNCSSQGQRRGRCRVNRRAERVIRPAKAKTRRLRVLVVTIC